MESTKRTCPCDEQIVGQDLIELLPLYTYQSLPGDKDSIRLLRLRPGQIGRPLRGSLLVFALEDVDDTYTALSYAWEGQVPKHAVECDGHKILVTCNLFSALSRSRSKDRVQLIFADALSINQATDHDALEERASQVRLMKHVFAKALDVLISLCEDFAHLDAALELLTVLANISDDTWQTALRDPAQLDVIGYPQPSSPVWSALTHLFASPWFGRIWVVQEYALARLAVFLIGRHRFPNSLLVKCRDRLLDKIREDFTTQIVSHDQTQVSHPLWSLDKRHGLSSMINMPSFRDVHNPGNGAKGRMTLADAMMSTKFLAASDPRDRVYGLLGLVTANDISTFTIDYTESVRDLSIRLSRFLIAHGDIHTALGRLACYGTGDCPSWAIDLQVYKRRPIGYPHLEETTDVNKAGPGTTDIDDNHITIDAYMIDSLRAMTAPFPLPSDQATLISRTFELSLSWLEDGFALASDLLSELYKSDPTRLVKDVVTAAVAGHGSPDGNENTVFVTMHLDELSRYLTMDRSLRKSWLDQHDSRLEMLASLSGMMLVGGCEVCLGVTDEGRICKVPVASLKGDPMAIISGVRTPVVMRDDRDGYRLVGDAYIHNVLQGEALLDFPRTKIRIY